LKRKLSSLPVLAFFSQTINVVVWLAQRASRRRTPRQATKPCHGQKACHARRAAAGHNARNFHFRLVFIPTAGIF
jgi:hypothetical protein